MIYQFKISYCTNFFKPVLFYYIIAFIVYFESVHDICKL